MSMRLASLPLVLGLWLVLPPGTSGAAKPAVDGDRLIFLLEYVGTDYAAAVRDGQVVNANEYGEVLRLTKEVIREYAARGRAGDAVGTQLRQLQELMVRRAPDVEVWNATRRLLPALAQSLGAGARPATVPSLARGRRLYAEDCAPCHGTSGAGDGPVASEMDPPPTAFRGDYLERLSPRQVYNAISLGVDGTAMPSFALAYSEQQRWDVAFFVLTLRPEFDPRRPPAGVRLTLEQIASSSNVELLAELRRARPHATPAEVDYFRTTFVSETGVTAPLAGPDAQAAGALPVALQLQDVFAAVADRVFPAVVGVSSYVRDPEWTLEKLQQTRGDAWTAGNPDALRYPGFRPLRAGSGLLVDDGYVLSCDHLVRDERGQVAAVVDVELPDQSHLATAVAGTEPTIDLAVLRIADPKQRPPRPGVEFGDSDRLETGHWVIALGDPSGAERVFRVGLVSGTAARQCYQEHLSATALQTSLDVPAGGLGGPVVDILGHVVGLSVRPATAPAPEPCAPTPSLTLPSNLILNLFEVLKVAQSQRSPWLGISVLELPALRRRVGSQAPIAIPPTGVYIDDVFVPSPASQAGVAVGDFLLALGGHAIRSVSDFQTWLYTLGIGAEAELELVRDGKPLRLVAPIEVRPEAARPR